jgi:ethanolamine-phosphate cytidylyltransferase
MNEKSGKVGFIDGCFDIFHYGHIHALYQAKNKCSKLIAATHTCDEIFETKGKKSLYDYKSRKSLLEECKFIDVVHDSVIYNTSIDILREKGCDYFFHGEDNIDESPLKELKEQGVLKVYNRTKGISTTNLNKRLSQYQNGEEIEKNNNYTYLKYLFDKMRPKEVECEDKIIILKYHWEMFNITHINTIKSLRLKYPDYKIYVDLVTPGEYKIFNQREIGIMLLGIKGIDVVLIDFPEKFKCNEVIYINTTLKVESYKFSYVYIPENDYWYPKTDYRLVPQKNPSYEFYSQIIKDQFNIIEKWLNETALTTICINDIIVLDIDEVCLCDLMYFNLIDFDSGSYSFNDGIIPKVEQSVGMFDSLHKNNIKYAFITGRRDYIRDITIKNLEIEKMDEYIELYTVPDDFIGSISTYKETCRIDLTKKGYNIIATIGDQVSDINGGFSGTPFLIYNPYYKTN